MPNKAGQGMADQKKVQIKGLIRFSYLSENGFAKSKQGVEKMRKMLYDPARLERRFAWFEKLAFHTLTLQDDTDFSVAIPFPASAGCRGRCCPRGLSMRLLSSGSIGGSIWTPRLSRC